MAWREGIREELTRLREAFDPTTVALFVIAGLSLCIYHYYGNDGFFDEYLMHRLPFGGARANYVRCLYWCFSPVVTLVLLPQVTFALARIALGRQPAPTSGLAFGDYRLGGAAFVLFYAVAFVLVAIVSRTSDFQGTYPLCGEAKHSPPYFLFYEFAYLCYFVAWESFFRGFLTFGLEKTFGMWAAFVQMLPFVVIHFDKPPLEAMSSVFGGLALGLLALRTRSFLYGAFIHAAMAITLDFLVAGKAVFHH